MVERMRLQSRRRKVEGGFLDSAVAWLGTRIETVRSSEGEASEGTKAFVPEAKR